VLQTSWDSSFAYLRVDSLSDFLYAWWADRIWNFWEEETEDTAMKQRSNGVVLYGQSTYTPSIKQRKEYMNLHIPHPRILERSKIGPHLTDHEQVGLNGRIAMLITNMVSTMWCAYLFAIIALISLPAAITGGTATLVSWIAQTFLQLVLLSVIMVGQKVAAGASDKQALQTFKDTEALLKIQDELHRLMKINTELTEEIHNLITKNKRNIKSR